MLNNIVGVICVICGCIAAIALSFNGMPDQAMGCFFIGAVSGIMINCIGDIGDE